jgi:hypothetical protein
MMGEEKIFQIFSSPIINNRVKKGLPARKKLGMTHDFLFSVEQIKKYEILAIVG